MDKTNPLDTLRDIRLPPPPAGLPDWVLLALAAFAFLSAVLLVLALLRRFRPDRRALFQRIDEALRLPDDAAVAQLAHVLRDEALHSAGPAAAQLTGDAWLGWLDRRYATRFFSEGAGQAFGDALYGRSTDTDAGRLAAGVRRVLAGPWWRPW